MSKSSASMKFFGAFLGVFAGRAWQVEHSQDLHVPRRNSNEAACSWSSRIVLGVPASSRKTAGGQVLEKLKQTATGHHQKLLRPLTIDPESSLACPIVN